MIDISHGTYAIVQHSDLHVVPWRMPYKLAFFGFNKVLMTS